MARALACKPPLCSAGDVSCAAPRDVDASSWRDIAAVVPAVGMSIAA